MNVEIDENWWKLQKLKIDEKCRYQQVTTIDENGRNLNSRNTKLMKPTETQNGWNLTWWKLTKIDES